MKLTFIAQMIVSIIIVILGNVLTDVFDFWVFRSIAFAICGLLFIVHPVVPKRLEGIDKAIIWTRIAGVILIFIGIFTRAHI